MSTFGKTGLVMPVPKDLESKPTSRAKPTPISLVNLARPLRMRYASSGAQRKILADERSLRLLRAAMLGVPGLFMYSW